MAEICLSSDSIARTEEIGAALARAIAAAMPQMPVFVAMYGDLGAGKTAFTRGFASVLSPGSRVKSPTYTVVNEYRRGPYPVFHFDLYRMEDPDSLDSVGFDEYLASGICIAEWSEHLGDRQPEEMISVTIRKCGDAARRITLALPEKVAVHFHLMKGAHHADTGS